jgi:hypothetical protein
MNAKVSTILYIAILTLVNNCFCNGQTVWGDTLKTNVDISHFDPGKKTVEIKYFNVIMIFSQQDYLGKAVGENTVKLTEKYADEYKTASLLKEGKAKVILRENKKVVKQFSHKLVQYGSMCDRIFSLPDGTEIFRVLEITGIFGAIKLPDSTELAEIAKKPKAIPKKEFAADEEFPDYKDKTKIRLQEYFPADTAMHYAYINNWVRDDNIDSMVCKSGMVEGQKIFYFAQEGYTKYPQLIEVNFNTFGEGIYFYRHDSLFVIKTDYEKDIEGKSLSQSQFIFPAYMKPGDSTTITDDSHKTVYTYLFKQSVKIGKTAYPECVKIKKIEYWDDTIYLSYIWLEQGIGVVKWMRETGRTDELIEKYRK